MQTVRNLSFMAEIIKQARYFPHSYESTISQQKLAIEGYKYPEESFIYGINGLFVHFDK